jgi:hypothetical protein
MTGDDSDSFASWALLELLGHRRIAGHLTERQVAGHQYLQITVPGDPPLTQLYSPSAVYAITPVSEETARRIAGRMRPESIHPWELPAAPKHDDLHNDREDDW